MEIVRPEEETEASKKDKIIQNKIENKLIDNQVKRQFEKMKPFNPAEHGINHKPQQPKANDFKNVCQINDIIVERDEKRKEEWKKGKDSIQIRNAINDLLALPYYKVPDKKKLLKHFVENNEIIQDVIIDETYNKLSNILNNKIRFCLQYGIAIYNTEICYNEYLIRQQQPQQKTQQQTQQQTTEKETSEETTEEKTKELIID